MERGEGLPPPAAWLDCARGRGAVGGGWQCVGLQPHLGSCYRRCRVRFLRARPSRRAVSCDRVSLSRRNVSLRPRPKGLHTLSASPLPAVVGGNRFIAERGCVGFRCLLQTPSTPLICLHTAGSGFMLSIR